MITIPLTLGHLATIAAVDYELISDTRWQAKHDGHTWYATRIACLAGGVRKRQYMHSVITGWPRVDHINGDGLDNRRVNLRPATRSQNLGNQRKTRGRSKFKGVSLYVAPSGWTRWYASIKKDRRQIFLGYHAVEDAAALAYDSAAREIFGEYAALNFPLPGERSALRGAQ